VHLTALRLALFENLIDDAGLFPSGSRSVPRLALGQALESFRGYQQGPQAFLLGRLVVGPLDLEPLVDLFTPFDSLRLTVVALHDSEDCYRAIEAFHARTSARVRVDTVEVKLDDSESWKWWTHHWGYHLFVEMTVEQAQSHLADFRWGPRVGAKLRLELPDGGALAAEQVLAFLRACWRARLPFKTAAAALAGTGFVPLVLGAAWTAQGVAPERLEPLLEQSDPVALRWSEDKVFWDELSLSLDELRQARLLFCQSVKACSFEQAVSDLKALQWI
jgi:hypothetical protein